MTQPPAAAPARHDAPNIACASCGAEVSQPAGARELSVACCDDCGAVHDLLPGRAPAGAAVERPSERHRRPPVALPRSLGIEARQDGLEISRRWFSPWYVALALASATWDALLLDHYAGALGAAGASVAALLSPALHAVLGGWLSYVSLAGLVNRSRLRVTPEALTVRHGPLPWPGALLLPAASVRQLYCRDEKARRGPARYGVHALLRDGSKRELLTGLENVDQALFIEQEIETRLGLRGSAVPGPPPPRST